MVGQITVRSSLGPDENLGADADSAGIKRPVHHSEVVTLQVNKVRPADTTAYAAGDLIGPATGVRYDFDLNAAGLPRGGLIVGARLIRRATGNTGVRFRASIHNAAIPTYTDADNAQHPLLWANRASRRGWVDFSSPQTGDAGSGNDCLEYAGVLSNAQGIVVDPSDGIVRVILTTRDAFTPVASEEFTLELELVI